MTSMARHFVVGKPHILAIFDGECVIFVEHNKKNATELGQVGIPNSPSRRLDTQSEVLIRRIADSRKPVVLRLAEHMGLVCYDRFPSTAKNDLRSIVAHRLDGLTPWSAEKVLFDAKITEQIGDGQIEVQIIAAPKEQIDAGLSGLAALGLSAAAADMVVDFPKAPCTLNFMGGTETIQKIGAAAWAAGFAAALLLMAGAWLYVELDEQTQNFTHREAFAAALETRLSDLPELHKTLDGLQHQSDLIAKRRQQQPSILLTIEDLSSMLPDGVWLERLTITGQEFTASGFAPDAEILLALIEDHEAFSKAEFTAASRQQEVFADGMSLLADSFALKAEIAASGTTLPEEE